IICTNLREPLLQSSINAFMGKPQEHQLPRKQGNLKKPASPSKKKTLVTIEEPAEKPAKKPTARRQASLVGVHRALLTSPLLTIPVLVIPESLTAPATTIPPPMPPFIPLQQQSTPIPTPTTTEATISTITAPNSTTLTAIHQRLSDLENEAKTLKNVDHSSTLLATIKSKVLTAVTEFLKTSIDDALYKKSVEDIHKIKIEQAGKQQETKYSITLSDTAELQEFDQKRTLFETMTKTKSFNKNTKYKALYHALMESILEDEDAMDQGVADKKAKSTRTSKGTTKSQSKSTGKSAQVEETVFETADTQVSQNLGEDMGNTDVPSVVNVDPKDWFKKLERPPTPDPEWNECKSVDDKPT
ncbi:hypothetical protein Tco_0556230, partial [Tanacetum coccineum]